MPFLLRDMSDMKTWRWYAHLHCLAELPEERQQNTWQRKTVTRHSPQLSIEYRKGKDYRKHCCQLQKHLLGNNRASEVMGKWDVFLRAFKNWGRNLQKLQHLNFIIKSTLGYCYLNKNTLLTLPAWSNAKTATFSPPPSFNSWGSTRWSRLPPLTRTFLMLSCLKENN